MRLAGSYAGRLGLTAWRRKSTVLGVAAILVLLLYCLQYSASAPRVDAPVKAAEAGPVRDAVGALAVNRGNVQFVASADKQRGTFPPDVPAGPADDSEAIAPKLADPYLGKANEALLADSPSRDAIGSRRKSLQEPLLASGGSAAIVEGRRALELTTADARRDAFNSYDSQGLYQMGIPYVNLDPQKPYVPTHRLLHLDLKGAPPKVAFLKRLFPLARTLGATGVLLEWEDMFPFSGPLATISAGNCYTHAEVREIVESARAARLEVIPLVQTFGHVEFALKHSAFSALREVPDSPQALCPSLNASMVFVEQLVAQVMAAHGDARFLHIGCDEVFQMGECPRCRNQMRETLFLAHVARVAQHVRATYKAVTPIIWDDMLRHVSTQSLEEFRIGELVEPMVWVYAEDVYRFVPSMIWDKYAAVFPRIWSASAFKGAFGETLYIPNAKRHLENNLRWLEVMTAEAPKFKDGFRGIAITGWQRYDHFSVLCELIPAAVPSLAVNLVATSHGYFNQTLKQALYSALGCPRSSPSHHGSGGDSIVSLNSDPFLWDKFTRCFFPGAPFFKLTYRLHAVQSEVRTFLDTTTRDKGWMTEFNIRHNFSSPLRVDELMADHGRVQHSLTSLVRAAQDSLADVFDSFTVAEWVEQRLYPDLRRLSELERDAAALKRARTWPRRPFPPLPALREHGLGTAADSGDADEPAAGDAK